MNVPSFAAAPGGPPTFETINRDLEYRAGRLVARDGALELRTVLQPILSVRHRRPIGCEALVRGQSAEGHEVPAWKIFSERSGDDALRLGRLCTNLHCRNFSAIASAQNWLFLNLNPAEFNEERWDDGYFPALLKSTGLRPHQIVFEVLESPVAERIDMKSAMHYLRGLGTLVAIDDFGAGHSNFERIWQLAPDIVKLDRSLLIAATRDRAMRRSLPSIVDILHQNRALVVAEGIETEAQAKLCMDASVDLVQGYLFALPFEITGRFPATAVDWSRLEASFEDTSDNSIFVRNSLVAHIARMVDLAERCKGGANFAEATRRLMELPRVMRCYMIDASGQQRDANVDAPTLARLQDPRFAPLADGQGANWVTRPYFRRAKQHPGEVQVSHEYLSCADARMCITLSVFVPTPLGHKVLCCDVNAD